MKTLRGESRFRTWLYRVARNHLLSAPKRKTEAFLETEPRFYSVFAEDSATLGEAEMEEVRMLCFTINSGCCTSSVRFLVATTGCGRSGAVSHPPTIR
ncbi:MAG: hypothetical protein ACK5EY_02550 [Cyclobacteriaceae bacterium]